MEVVLITATAVLKAARGVVEGILSVIMAEQVVVVVVLTGMDNLRFLLVCGRPLRGDKKCRSR